VLTLFMLFENKLIFFPLKHPGGDWSPAGLRFEDAWFASADGVHLHGWFVPHASPRAFVLVSHGNGGNLSGRIELLRALSRMGASTLIYDYRGYGRSAGSPTGRGIIEDGRAALRWLSDRAGVPPGELVQFGESLGGAVAVQLASESGARGLVLENTFSSLVDVGAYHYPWLPVRLLLSARLDSESAIRRYRGPLLQSHGDRDSVVPYELGRRLFEAANDPKELITVRGGEHHHLSREFLNALDRFLRKL
jgi:fermentation-respiration switch protein FrsA (DUF1100 family)